MGFEKGTNQYSMEKIFTTSFNSPTNRSDLASIYGITKQTMNNYMRLTKAIPELEELLDTGVYIFDYPHTIIHSIDNALQIDI